MTQSGSETTNSIHKLVDTHRASLCCGNDYEEEGEEEEGDEEEEKEDKLHRSSTR